MLFRFPAGITSLNSEQGKTMMVNMATLLTPEPFYSALLIVHFRYLDCFFLIVQMTTEDRRHGWKEERPKLLKFAVIDDWNTTFTCYNKLSLAEFLSKEKRRNEYT